MKECYNHRALPGLLRAFLEKESGSKITKLRLLWPTKKELESLSEIPFWRFRVEGISDRNFGNRKVNTLFKKIGPALQAAYPGHLLRIAKEIGWHELVLDMSSEDALFTSFDKSGFLKVRDLSQELLHPLQSEVKILSILPSEKILRRIRKRKSPNL